MTTPRSQTFCGPPQWNGKSKVQTEWPWIRSASDFSQWTLEKTLHRTFWGWPWYPGRPRLTLSGKPGEWTLEWYSSWAEAGALKKWSIWSSGGQWEKPIPESPQVPSFLASRSAWDARFIASPILLPLRTWRLRREHAPLGLVPSKYWWICHWLLWFRWPLQSAPLPEWDPLPGKARRKWEWRGLFPCRSRRCWKATARCTYRPWCRRYRLTRQKTVCPASLLAAEAADGICLIPWKSWEGPRILPFPHWTICAIAAIRPPASCRNSGRRGSVRDSCKRPRCSLGWNSWAHQASVPDSGRFCPLSNAPLRCFPTVHLESASGSKASISQWSCAFRTGPCAATNTQCR